MRTLVIASALAIGGSALPLAAQTTLDYPVGQFELYPRDSGVRANPGNTPQTVYVEMVRIEGAAWLRIYFAVVELAPGSTVRMTSMLDGEVQELDADGLMMWQDTSAYFNGDTVMVELIAAPKSRRNRMVIDQVARTRAAHPVGAPGQCGICGADDRVPSNENWSGRLFPAGCTASVWNEASCLVSAGHCIGGGPMAVHFNVPDSNPNCSINSPPIADQFPILATSFTNGGPGNDWSVLTTGTNNLGQTIFERYGQLRPIATTPGSAGQTVSIWGFGVDLTCALSQTQQTDSGSITSVFSSSYRFDVDITGGNSGSGLIRNGEIIGIATHCPCPNVATRVDLASFAAARAAICPPPCPVSDDNLEPNDSCAAAGSLPTGTFPNLVVELTDEDWYEVSVTLATLTVDVSFTHLFGNIDLELYDACGGTLVAFSDSVNSNESIVYNNFGSPDLFLRVFLNGDECNSYDLTTSITPLHDLCANSLFAGPSTTFANIGASTDGPSEAANCNFNGDNQIQSDVWYRYVAQCDGTATVSLCGSNYDTKIAIYPSTGFPASCPVVSGTVIACNNDFCGQQSEVSFEVTSSTFYLIRIGGHQGAQGQGTMTITCVPDVLPCPEDINGDGDINVIDLINVLLCFGLPDDPPCHTGQDVNADGNVNVLDLIDVLLLFGTSCP